MGREKNEISGKGFQFYYFSKLFTKNIVFVKMITCSLFRRKKVRKCGEV